MAAKQSAIKKRFIGCPVHGALPNNRSDPLTRTEPRVLGKLEVMIPVSKTQRQYFVKFSALRLHVCTTRNRVPRRAQNILNAFTVTIGKLQNFYGRPEPPKVTDPLGMIL